jgi:hypothetical protein
VAFQEKKFIHCQCKEGRKIMNIIVHVRRYTPGFGDTFLFERSFETHKDAENFISRGGWRIAPDADHSNSYAVIVN